MNSDSPPKKTFFHIAQSVDGALRNWNPSQWRDCCRDATGKLLTPVQVKREFKKLQAAGVKFIPMGDCNNFDPEKGCRGHDMETE